MDGGTDQTSVPRLFDPEKLVVEVNECFDGFHFSIQTYRPDRTYAERVKTWFEGKAAAESRGAPFDDPPPVLSYSGLAVFESCAGEYRESGFVLRLSMKTEKGRHFTIFINEDEMFPEDGGDPGPRLEASIAARLAFWTQEMICHGTVEELDGRAVGSGEWMKTWT